MASNHTPNIELTNIGGTRPGRCTSTECDRQTLLVRGTSVPNVPSRSSSPLTDTSRTEPASSLKTLRRKDYLDDLAPTTKQPTHSAAYIDLVITRIFSILSITSVSLAVLNFLQIGLLERINHPAWIKAPPAGLLTLGIAILVFYLRIGDNWQNALVAWKKAPRGRRVVWIGIALTAMLPPLVCQYLYMNWVAIPAFRDIIWSASLDYDETIMPPAIMIFDFHNSSVIGDDDLANPYVFHDPSTAGQANFTQSLGNCTKFNALGSTTDCSGSVQWNLADSNVTYHLFDPKPNNLTLLPRESVELDFPIVYNTSNGTRQSYFTFAFIDPNFVSIVQNNILPNIMKSNCSAYTLKYLPSLGTNYITIESQVVVDKMGTLKPNISTLCNITTDVDVNNYTTYSTTVVNLPLTNPSLCDVSATNYLPCWSSYRIMFGSNMVSTRSSERGTDWAKILTDEGGIAGGIAFFTWFLSIYAG